MPSFFFPLAVWTLQLLVLSRCDSAAMDSTANSSGDQIHAHSNYSVPLHGLIDPTFSYPSEDHHKQFIPPTQYDCSFNCWSYTQLEKLACIKWKHLPEQLERCQWKGSGQVEKNEEELDFEDFFEKTEEMAATEQRNGNNGMDETVRKNWDEKMNQDDFDINKFTPPKNKEVVVSEDSIKKLEEVFNQRQKTKWLIFIAGVVGSAVFVVAVVAVIYIYCVKHKYGSKIFIGGNSTSTFERSDALNLA